MEGFNPQQNVPETPSSREGVIINKMIEKNIDLETISEETVRDLLAADKKLKVFGVTIDGVIDEMKRVGYLKEPIVEKGEDKKLISSKPEIVGNYVKLKGVTEIHDEELQELLEQNKFYEELAGSIFKNANDLEAVYEQAVSLEKDYPLETLEYYKAFAHLVRGGITEIETDLKGLADRLELFKEGINTLSEQDAVKTEKMKKIATIVERAIIYAVTTVGWYGHGISIEPVSQFDDVKRGVDGVLQITEEGERNNFLGLGVDATFRGLLSAEYKNKFSKLLGSIEGNYKTKIKYFKNHQGEMMEEFAVPKIVLYFDNADVKNLVTLVKNSNDTAFVQEFKNNPQKGKVMNQIIAQCQMLSAFAQECNNSIYKKYDEFVAAVARLAENNPEIQLLLDASKETDVSKHIKYLIEEFKKEHKETALY